MTSPTLLPKGPHATIASSDGAVVVDTLENGVRVASYPGVHLSRAHVGVGLRAGPRHETRATWGLSHIVEHMVFRGTDVHEDSHAVSLAADAFGGEIDASTWRDRMLFETRTDPDAIGDAVRLLGEMWLRPKLEGLDTEREVLREEFLEALDDDGQMVDADTVALQNLLPDHAVGKSIEGTLDALDAYTRADVERHWDMLCSGANLVVVAAGAVDHAALVEHCRQVFGALPQKQPPEIGEPAPGRRKRVREVRTDQSQTTLRLGFRLPSVGELGDDLSSFRRNFALLERILDDGPASRLQEIVDREGLAYEVWTDLDTYAEGGVFEFGAQVAHERVGVVVERLLKEVRAILRDGVFEAERARAIKRVRRDFADLRDEPESACDALFRTLLRGEIFDPKARLEEIEGVTCHALQADAQRWLVRDHLHLTLVGRPTRAAVAAAERAMERM